MERTPQVLRAVRVASKPPLETLPELARALAQADAKLAGRGRILLRYSGTEPVARVMLEGDDRAEIETIAAELCALIQRAIGETR
jgi:phosphoglucosamine mutase